MSDDDEYYEWEEDFPFEDVGPDVVVSPPSQIFCMNVIATFLCFGAE